MCQIQNNRHGSALEHGDAHAQEHRLWSRRDFLSATGLFGAGSVLLGGVPARALQLSPQLAALSAATGDRVLVLIRLDGGNDGLNTVVQRGNSYYYNLRPKLALKENELWALSPEYGMPLETKALQPLWDQGMMKVLFNVGYPKPNYSHFRSFDIIATGSDSGVVEKTGWMGRFLENEYPAFLDAPPSVPPALQIGLQSDLTFQADEANMALAISSPEEFYQIAQSGQLYPTEGLGATLRETELAFLRQTANASFRYATTIQQAYNTGKNEVTYPSGNKLAEQMAIIARLIKGRLGTRIFLVELTAFDTHAQQRDFHLSLLNQVATAVRAFYDDLASAGNALQSQVLSMTYSEFGRSIYENGSGGTDHGWGTHNLMFGGDIGNGFVGQYQDLSFADPVGDPPASVDFRDIYATLLQDWLGNSAAVSQFVLGKDFPTLPGLLPPAMPALGDNDKGVLLGHNPYSTQPGVFEIKYALQQSGIARLQLLDKAGHVLRTLFSEVKPAGSHTYRFSPAEWFLPPGTYQYRLQSGGKVFQREIRW